MSWERFDINLLNSGGTVESLHSAVQEAFDDIKNMNKPAAKSRKVVLTLEFVPDEDRESVAMKATVKTTFPSENPNIDMIQLHPDTKTGYINTSEQLPLGYDPVTGEIVSPLIRKEGQELLPKQFKK
jgi:hypothetical protein